MGSFPETYNDPINFGLNLGFWDTAYLSLPKAKVIPFVRSKC